MGHLYHGYVSHNQRVPSLPATPSTIPDKEANLEVRRVSQDKIPTARIVTMEFH